MVLAGVFKREKDFEEVEEVENKGRRDETSGECMHSGL